MTKFKVGDKVKASAYYLGNHPDDYFEGFIEGRAGSDSIFSGCYLVNVPTEEDPSGFPLLEEELELIQ